MLTHNGFASGTAVSFEVTSAEDFGGNGLVAGSVPNPWTFTTEEASGIRNVPNPSPQIFIYPNPLMDNAQLIVECALPGETGELVFSLYNTLGKEVKRVNIHPDLSPNGYCRGIISRDHLPCGLYMYRLTSGNGMNVMGKLVIQD